MIRPHRVYCRMKSKILLFSVCFFVSVCSGCLKNSSPSGKVVISPENLRFEYLMDPPGIHAVKPGLPIAYSKALKLLRMNNSEAKSNRI